MKVNYILARHGYPMVVVRNRSKKEYLEALNRATLAYLQKEVGVNRSALQKMLANLQEKGYVGRDEKGGSPIPDIKSTETTYDYYIRREASAERFMCHVYRGIYYLAKNDSVIH